jgi:hypothetical protein
MTEDAMFTSTLIADRIEIADLFTRLARLLDEQRWEDADTVFTDDVAVYSLRAGELRGIDNSFVYFYRDGQVPHLASGLRLAGTVVRMPTGWRFREYQITPAWIREN